MAGYLFVAAVIFLCFVVKYYYEAEKPANTFNERMIIVGDLLQRLGAALAWLPIAIYYAIIYRHQIAGVYRKFFNKDCQR